MLLIGHPLNLNRIRFALLIQILTVQNPTTEQAKLLVRIWRGRKFKDKTTHLILIMFPLCPFLCN